MLYFPMIKKLIWESMNLYHFLACDVGGMTSATLSDAWRDREAQKTGENYFPTAHLNHLTCGPQFTGPAPRSEGPPFQCVYLTFPTHQEQNVKLPVILPQGKCSVCKLFSSSKR